MLNRFDLFWIVKLTHSENQCNYRISVLIFNVWWCISFDEEIVVALPMVKSNSVCIIPPTVSLKVHLAANADNIKQSKEFLHVHDQCLNKYAQVAHLIQVSHLSFARLPSSSIVFDWPFQLQIIHQFRDKWNYAAFITYSFDGMLHPCGIIHRQRINWLNRLTIISNR